MFRLENVDEFTEESLTLGPMKQVIMVRPCLFTIVLGSLVCHMKTEGRTVYLYSIKVLFVFLIEL